MGATATAPPPSKPAGELDPDALAAAAADIGETGADDGLGPDKSGIPGGALPQDDRHPGNAGAATDDPPVDPPADPPADPPPADPPADPPASASGEGGAQPPTPPASLPDDGEGEEEAEAPQLFVTGERAIGVKVGGRKPDSSVLKLKGGKIDLAGQFDRGDRFIAVATLQVVGDNDQDTIDKQSGEVKSTSKAQSATLCGFARIEEWLADKLGEDQALLNTVLEKLELLPAEEA